MSFLVATNVVASRPPERRPTGTPHARAKILSVALLSQAKQSECGTVHFLGRIVIEHSTILPNNARC